jgi:hypothetical protein
MQLHLAWALSACFLLLQWLGRDWRKFPADSAQNHLFWHGTKGYVSGPVADHIGGSACGLAP